MQLIGESIADQKEKITLIGVAPAGKVTYPDGPSRENVQDSAELESHHTHFVLVESDEWGGETKTIIELVKTLATDNKVLIVLVNGGDIARREIFLSVRQGWQVIVIENTGRLADQIANLYRKKKPDIDDPMLAEILIDGKIHLLDVKARPEELEKLIMRLFPQHHDPILNQAWGAFAVYDYNAQKQQRTFDRMQRWILILGIVVTALVLTKNAIFKDVNNNQVIDQRNGSQQADSSVSNSTQPRQPSQLGEPSSPIQSTMADTSLIDSTKKVVGLQMNDSSQTQSAPKIQKPNTESKDNLSAQSAKDSIKANSNKNSESEKQNIISRVMRYIIIIIPILISILIAAANRFKAGNKWVLLRGAAEALKKEIFRYRSGIPLEETVPPEPPQSRQEYLAHKLETISRNLMRTEVNLSALELYHGPIPPEMYGAAVEDDGLSPLDAQTYLDIRLGDQLSYYRLKTVKLEKQLKRLQWSIFIFGGLGTFLAAIGWEIWIAMTTTIIGALTTFLEYRQNEKTLMIYNQAATDLANIKIWWIALSNEEKGKIDNHQKLVDNTEKVLQGEMAGWVQQMENALAELRAKQGDQPKDGKATATPTNQL
jgi:hypothetical protein